ncbi:MAG: alkaline phosphatase family protein [Aggregatilineales bacterium]
MIDFRFSDLATTLEQDILTHRLLDVPAEWGDEVIFPAYQQQLTLPNVIHSLTDMLGAPFADNAPLLDRVWGDEKPDNIQRVVLLLLDGTGYKHLQMLMQDDSELQEIVSDLTAGRGIVPLTTVAPSTTAVALTSLWTGGTPGQTAIPGTTVYLRELSMLVNMLLFKPETGRHPVGVINDWGISADDLVQRKGLAAHLAEHDIPSHLLLHKMLSGTGLSKILHRGVTDIHTHIGYSDMYGNFRQLLHDTAGQRAYINFYIPSVDSLGHQYGSHTPQTATEVKYQLSTVRDVLNDETVQDGQTLFILMADHGHHDALEHLDILSHEGMQHVRDDVLIGLSGDSRLAHLYIRDGRRDTMKAALSEHFADQLTYIDTDAAIAAGFYGEVNPIMRRRLGDLILIPRLNHVITDPTIGIPPLIGWHGGLDAWEMLIPFIWRVL